MNSVPLSIVCAAIIIILAIIIIIVCFQFMTANRLIERLKKHHNYQADYNGFMLKGLLDHPDLKNDSKFKNIIHELNEQFAK
jgi:ABC-type bacteriocin/lantibiotic exporter with double-glycine peptidase domain